jgi:hypothetical protein
MREKQMDATETKKIQNGINAARNIRKEMLTEAEDLKKNLDKSNAFIADYDALILSLETLLINADPQQAGNQKKAPPTNNPFKNAAEINYDH